jgi:antitoxin MazE
MKTSVQKWGNSLALRIPKALALETGLAEGSLVELSSVEGKLVISLATSPSIALDDLLREITDENIHTEIDAGPAVGGEAW